VVLALGLAAGVLMLASLISTVASVDVANGSCSVIYDFVLLGLVALVMAFGAGPARSRGAAWALVGVGLIAVLVGLLSDLPVTDDTGAIGRDFEGATASAGTGLWFEIVGGACALAAGALRLLAPRPADHGAPGDPRRGRRQAAHGKHERPTDVARAERRAARASHRQQPAEE
jgi:membrane-bound metal-dependent hydrolase YbcI (DUF457 family)